MTPEPAAAPVGPRRSARGWRDMARSLVVLLIPVAIIVGIYRFQGGEDVVVVDTAPAYANARAAQAFPVLEPTGLDAGWRTVSAAYQVEPDGAVLRVGYLTPDEGQTQLVQSSRPAAALVKDELGESGTPLGTVNEAGLAWQVYAVRDGEHAIVSVSPDRTVIVVGATDVATLRTLAGALR
ncbi:hypothetical protein GCM10009681_00690 [Luedemannella helvata]|uniref:DUF4245 domain-containing protein n=1 Tax=Luedemannella helvata TaxID=349315 RepID=A0ABN2JP74_9ACTN